MTASALEKCLTHGLKPEEWFAILNDRSFFWLSKTRLNKLLNARAYRDRPQTVLTVDTNSLVETHREKSSSVRSIAAQPYTTHNLEVATRSIPSLIIRLKSGAKKRAANSGLWS